MCNPIKAASRATGIGPDNNPTPQNGGLPAAAAPQPSAPAPKSPVTSNPSPSSPSPDYGALADDYTKFFQPQVQGQYNNAQNALQLGLADRGLTGSNIDKQFTNDLGSAYASKMASLPSDANTYAHSQGADGKTFTPLGDLFTSIIKPVATFNANNSYGPYAGAGMAGAPGINLSGGSNSRVVS